MDVETRIEQYASQLFKSEDFRDHFLLEVRATGTKYEVFIDGDKGVNVEQCKRVSRYLEKQLEENGVVEGKYTLEVSSPGVDRPLTEWRQYGKHTGRDLKVTLLDGTEFKGRLDELGIDTLTLVEKQKSKTVEHVLSFDDIKESVVQIRFN